jgi:hypothetical protein
MGPNPLAEAVVRSAPADSPARDHGEASVTFVRGTARWREPGPKPAAGHGRGELALSVAALTFELRSGQRTFVRTGGEVRLTTRFMRPVVSFEDRSTTVHVTVAWRDRRRLRRALRGAGLGA